MCISRRLMHISKYCGKVGKSVFLTTDDFSTFPKIVHISIIYCGNVCQFVNILAPLEKAGFLELLDAPENRGEFTHPVFPGAVYLTLVTHNGKHLKIISNWSKNMEKENSSTYNLYLTVRRYKEESFLSYYFQSNSKIIKRFEPIDIGNERLRLDKTTGEIRTYKKSEIDLSRSASIRRTIIMINMLLAMNDFDWFWTLTFDKDKIDRYDDAKVFNCYKKYINNLKHKFPNFRYVCFPERHKDEDNCLHFHLVTAGISAKDMGLVDSGKVCCHWAMKNGRKIDVCSKDYFERTKHLHELKETDGEPVYNITTFAYGYTTVSRICSRERCNTYVKKYVQKDIGSTEIFKKRFYYSSNLNVPDIVKILVGADFENAKTNLIDVLQNDKYIQNSKGQPYLSEHNVLQAKIDNEIKDNLDKGLSPIELDDLPF